MYLWWVLRFHAQCRDFSIDDSEQRLFRIQARHICTAWVLNKFYNLVFLFYFTMHSFDNSITNTADNYVFFTGMWQIMPVQMGLCMKFLATSSHRTRMPSQFTCKTSESAINQPTIQWLHLALHIICPDTQSCHHLTDLLYSSAKPWWGPFPMENIQLLFRWCMKKTDVWNIVCQARN